MKIFNLTCNDLHQGGYHPSPKPHNAFFFVCLPGNIMPAQQQCPGYLTLVPYPNLVESLINSYLKLLKAKITIIQVHLIIFEGRNQPAWLDASRSKRESVFIL